MQFLSFLIFNSIPRPRHPIIAPFSNPLHFSQEKKEPVINIKDIPLFKGLTQSEVASVQRCLKEKIFEKGEVLFFEGAGCERIFIVQSGRIKIYRMTPGGREQILETLGPGDTCACNPGTMVWHCSSTAEAVVPSKVWYLSREEYVKMVQTNSRLALSLNKLFADRLQCFSSLIEEVSLKDAKKRLVKFLLDMLEKRPPAIKANDALFIPFTREEIAQRLGTARETVARYLSQLKRAKLISIKPYQIVILDKEGLHKLLK